MYDQVIAAAMESPWAILPEKLAVIEAFLARKANGEILTEAEIEAAMPRRNQPSGPPAPAGVGVLPIHGTITHRANIFSRFSGGTSAEVAGYQLDQMANDPTISAIVMDISSPGGSVYGIEQFAMKIQAAGKKKPVIAVANSLAASAAYWIASNATELIVAPDAEVGAIGVFTMHVDQTASRERDGQKVTLIKAGRLKASGQGGMPLTEESLATIQKGVNDYYELFVSAVARGRGVPVDQVRNGFGEGSTVRAKEAVALGMADRIGTLDSVLARYGLSTADMQMQASESRPAYESRRRRLAI
jgi:capsid assembly protease